MPPDVAGAVAVGVGAVPAPGGRDDVADVGIPGRPAELLGDLLRAGDERARVAGAAGDDLVPDRPADGLLAGAEDFEHGDPGAGAEVVRPGDARPQPFDGELVRLGEV